MGNRMIKAAVLRFSEIQLGAVYQFSKEISKQDVMDFAKLTDDFNPLHVDPDFAKKTSFKKNIIHGMLSASFFSTLVGMYCPGENSLFMSQTVKFKLPLYYDDKIMIKGTVIAKNESVKLITLKTEILKGENIAVEGEAIVKFLGE